MKGANPNSPLVLPRKRQGPEKRFCLDVSIRPVSCRHGGYLSQLVDGDDAVVGGQRFNKSNRVAVVVLANDHCFLPFQSASRLWM